MRPDELILYRPTPFKSSKGAPVLRLDDTARAMAQLRITEARKGRMDPYVHDVSLQEFLEEVQP